jgi:hypothetical protein
VVKKMGLKKYLKRIGKECYIKIDGMKINCKLLNIKQSYGNVRLLISPINGDGKTWKNEESVFFMRTDY